MKYKIISILICMLLLTVIPIAAGITIQENPQPSRIGWTTIQGFLLTRPREINGGALIMFRCLFVHYVAQSIVHRVTGFRYGGQMMVIPNTFRGVLMPHMIMGWCIGALEF